jgi:hypothetical protein
MSPKASPNKEAVRGSSLDGTAGKSPLVEPNVQTATIVKSPQKPNHVSPSPQPVSTTNIKTMEKTGPKKEEAVGLDEIDDSKSAQKKKVEGSKGSTFAQNPQFVAVANTTTLAITKTKDYAVWIGNETIHISKGLITLMTDFIHRDPKKAMIGGGILLVLLVTFVTLLALFLPVTDTAKPSPIRTTLVYPSNETLVLDAGDYYVASSESSGQLYKLTKVSSSGAVTVVGRSFDGYNWESMSSVSMNFDCNILSGFCTVTIPYENDGSYYQIQSLNTKTFSMDNTSIAATFLMQATFGQTRATISDFLHTHKGDFSSWITSQMNEPEWLHRTYYRKRTNTRLDIPTVVGGVRMPCDYGSRWHRFAFNDADVGKTVVVTELSSKLLSFSIDDITITDVSPSVYNASIYGWSFDICEVEESIGGTVTVGDGDDCDIDIENPIITISELQADYLLINSTSYTNFTEIEDVKNIYLFTGAEDDMSSCDQPIVTPLFASTAHGVLKFDPRIVTLDNTVETPIDFSTSSDQECPVVAKTFLNVDGCIADRITCSPILYSSALFQLNETSIRYFYTIAGLYVYYVSGLRPEDDKIDSPCSGDTSRWVNRKNESDACTNTFGNQTIINMISNSLAAVATDDEDGSSSRVREITMTCSDADEELIGVKVQVGSECWEHAHPEEFNVYDFSIWTRAHPGG